MDKSRNLDFNEKKSLVIYVIGSLGENNIVQTQIEFLKNFVSQHKD